MNTAIYTLTSPLHDVQAVDNATKAFLQSLGIEYVFRGEEYADYGTHALDLIYVRTGGTEGVFRRLLADLRQKSSRPFYLLTSGESNSLAASMEILSYLRQHDIPGEILHGRIDYIAHRIEVLHTVGEALRRLSHTRLGVVGQPSDWLISSTADRVAVRQRLGIELVDIDLQEVLDRMPESSDAIPTEWNDKATSSSVRHSLNGAVCIYESLKQIVSVHALGGFTLRCFDLLTALHNTGCLALARLNSEGIVAGCEGDIPAMLSMTIAQALFGVSGFQCNPAHIDTQSGELLLAHCTIPFDMLQRFELDTHFESGIGVGIRGYMPEGPVTLFKAAGDLGHYYVSEGILLRCEDRPNLCRTQAVVQLDNPSDAAYFLTRPIGNHHILLPGRCRETLDTFFNF
ncbi:MAG: hypothetical protein K5778_04835 [Bacteroidaceae bacterium]|nr:hypothetical protein [Bacteroidaceae bacterium]